MKTAISGKEMVETRDAGRGAFRSGRAPTYHRRLEVILFTIAAALGICGSYVSRFAGVTIDSIGYLDVAKTYLRHDWPSAVNLTWPPVFSWLLAAAFTMVHPTLRTEVPIAHAVQCVVYLATLLAFRFCWKELGKLRGTRPLTGQELRAWYIVGYTLFVVMLTPFSTLLTPDIATGFVVFLATGLLARVAQGQASTSKFLLLGLTLGFGYLVKTVFLPLGIAALGVTGLVALKQRKFNRFLIAPLALLLVAGPWVLILSRSARHFNWGGAGRVTYNGTVNNQQKLRSFDWASMDWTEKDPDAWAKLIVTSPRVYRTDVLPNVTYSFIYDHARVDQTPVHFSARNELRAIALNMKFYRFWFGLLQGGLLFVAAVHLFSLRRRAVAALAGNVHLFALPVFAIGLYTLVYAEGRLVAPFCVVLWGAWMAVVPVPRALTRLNATAWSVAALFLLLCGLPLIAESLFSRPDDIRGDLAVAEALQESGVERGSRIGIVGSTGFVWAHLLDAAIVAEVPAADEFAKCTPQQGNNVLEAMRSSGVRHVVSVEPGNPEVQFRKLPHTGLWYRDLGKSHTTASEPGSHD